MVLGLLVAMSNTEHPESCKHAIDAVSPTPPITDTGSELNRYGLRMRWIFQIATKNRNNDKLLISDKGFLKVAGGII